MVQKAIKYIANLLIAIGAGLLIWVGWRFVEEHTNIPNLITTPIIGTELRNLWLVGIVVFVVGYLLLRGKKALNSFKNWQQITLKLITEFVSIILVAFLTISVLIPNISIIFRIASLITVIILFYAINEIEKEGFS
jgi:hypothetical protein